MTPIIIVAALILLNGVFALSELAIVSSRKTRLRTLVDKGKTGARAALSLAENPGRFLSTVQIGITLVGILAGAVSGAALSERLDTVIENLGAPTRVAEPVAYTLVIVTITYFSVVIGELVPKNLALRNPEAFACLLAPLMVFLSKAAAPAVWLLERSTNVVFRLFGANTNSDNVVTEEEVRLMLTEATTAGVIENDERAMISGIMRLSDRTVSAIMTPRVDVDLIDVSDGADSIAKVLTTTPHSRLPVYDGDPDAVIGVVHARELLAVLLQGGPLDVRSIVRQAPIIPDTLAAMEALHVLREAEVPLALVHDEYGHFDGIVAPADILDAIAGAFRADEGASEPDAVRRADGSWLLSGSMPIDEMAELLGIEAPSSRDYDTVAGFAIDHFARLPGIGEVVEAQGWRFEVVDIDGRRIDKILAARISALSDT
ncbi:MAG: hemolysin family protein [Microvirga sp.]|nr:hemolysin family protein [Microvirga sp.]